MGTVNTQERRPGAGKRNTDALSTDAQSRALGLSTGWSVFSYMISGMAAYGLIGWLVGRAVHISLLFPLGMIVGLGISVGWVIYRFGRSPDGPLDAGLGHGNERGDDR